MKGPVGIRRGIDSRGRPARPGRADARKARRRSRKPAPELPATEGFGPRFSIVGLGASAGGLQALEEFFGAMPSQSGIAFVVVTHLHPDRPSLMRELLARKTDMPVREVRKATVVEQDHVYISLPGWNLGLLNGVLHPMAPPKQPQGRPALPIDYFFRSLAADQKAHAVGVVLSGTGSDGTLGLKEIKGNLGMVMAQERNSAAYTGMPDSAIATRMVDFILPAREMPGQLLKYVSHLSTAPTRVLSRAGSGLPPEDLQRLFVLLRNRSGHDFSQYKENTIRRRIERRMNVQHLESLKGYVRFLQEHPEDLDHLFKELLIGVTSFFRDADAFEALIRALPELLSSRAEKQLLRVWVPGCSTGEEAYSIAILIRECLDRLKQPLGVQIFASDLDPEAINVARLGRYPAGIALDVTAGRLEQFFVREKDTFLVRKEIREMLVFAPQNLISDPPFTKLDLLSCRNVLIYLGPPLQKRLFPMFHFALKPSGLLFLGSSESLGMFGSLFEPVDKKWKVYRRREVPAGSYLTDFSPGRRGASNLLPGSASAESGAQQPHPSFGAGRLLLQELVAPTVLIRERGDVVHIHGHTGQFLEPAPGPQATPNVFNMARPGLELQLAGAVGEAANSDKEIIHHDVRIASNGDDLRVDLRVRRVQEPGPFRGLFLVTFDNVRVGSPRKATPAAPSRGRSSRSHDRIADLEQQLHHTKERHRFTTEDLETANEELKSSNEELQSTNEELQSANEELETSKEEMQSLNEELQTVNAELQDKVDELSHSNDDMKNLLNSTDIATLFLDGELNIKRYTEQATRVIHLIASDVGRPLTDLVPRLRYDRLFEDAREVLRTLVVKEVEIRAEDGTWYLMRVLPYRTDENVIDGLVLTFVDITKIRSLQQSERRLLEALKRSTTTVFGQDRQLRFVWSWSSVFGHTMSELMGKTDADFLPAGQATVLDEIKRGVIASESPARKRVTLSPRREDRTYDLFVEPMRAEGGEIVGVSCVLTDITDLEESPEASLPQPREGGSRRRMGHETKGG